MRYHRLLQKSLLFASTALLLRALAGAIREPYRFEGRVALVTGASRGLGYLLARRLLERGCKVAICSRTVPELLRAERILKTVSSEVYAIPCDLTREEECRRFVQEALTRFGRIDILINNAGVIVSGPEALMDKVDYDELMKIHFWAPYHLTQAVREEMRQRGGGRIVNVSSIGGKIPVPHLLPYTASKFALRGFSGGLRSELKRQNILVTTVCPGLMRTGSHINAIYKGNHKVEYSWFRILSSIPLVSMNVEYAAAEILRALERGQSELVIGAAAKCADLLNGVAPGIYNVAAEAANYLLPYRPSRERRRGKEILVPPIIRAITSSLDRASKDNLEIPPNPHS